MSKKRKNRKAIQIRKHRRRVRQVSGPDYKEPFGPPSTLCQIYCIHCHKKYWSDQIKWNQRDELWVCRDYEFCGGAGFGIDIVEVTDKPGPWLYA
jgi:hypothetical protein